MAGSGVFTLKRLELENVYSYSRAALEFEEGLVAFAGSNGSGKTSMIESMLLALTLNRKIVRSEIIRRAGGSPAPQGRISLTLDGGEAMYTVTIHLRPRRSSDEIVAAELVEERGGTRKVRATGVTAVKSELARLLGFQGLPDYGEFVRHSVFAQQGYLREIAEKLGKDFRDIIEAALGLKSLQDAVDRLSGLVVASGSYSVAIGTARGLRSSGNYRRILAELERARTRLREARERARRAEEELARLQQRRAEVERRLEEARRAAARLESLERSAESLKSMIEKVRRELAAAEREAEETARRIRALDERRRRLEEAARLAEAARLIEEYRRLSLEAERLRLLVEQLDDKIRILRDLQRYRGDAERYLEAKKRLEEAGREIERLKSRIEVLRSAEDQARLFVGRLERIARQWGIKWDSGDPGGLVRSLENLLDEARRAKEELEEERERLVSEASRVKAMLDEARKALEAVRSSTRPECPVCGRPLDREGRVAIIRRLSREAERLEAELEDLEEELGGVEEALRREQARLEALERSLSHASEIASALSSLLASHGFQTLEDLRGELGRLEVELRRLVAEKRELEREVGRLEQAYKRYLAALSRAERLGIDEAELDDLEREYREASRRLADLESRLDELEKEILEATGARSVGEAERLVAEARRAAEELARLGEELAGLKTKLGMLEDRKRELASREAELAAELEKLRREMEALAGAAREAERLAGELDEISRMVEKLLSERASASKEAEHMEESIKALEGLRRKFLVGMAVKVMLERLQEAAYEEAVKRLIDEMNSFLAEFNLNITRVERDGSSFRLVAYRDGGARAELSTLSGGEKAALALAFLMAFNRVVGGRLSFLVLDEPTAELDEERRRTLMDLLRRLASEGAVSQVIVVAHHADVLDLADRGCVVRYERGRGSVVEC